MAQRKTGATSTNPASASQVPKPGTKGSKQTAAQKRAAQENLRKGREARDRKRREAQEAAERGEVRDTTAVRWSKLLDGTLSVVDLDDEELARMQVRGKDGEFNGFGRTIPSGIAQSMQREAIKRATEMFRMAAPRAVKRLLEIADDPDVKESDAIRALDIVLNRGLGKMPETVLIEEKSRWDEAQESAFGGVDRTEFAED